MKPTSPPGIARGTLTVSYTADPRALDSKLLGEALHRLMLVACRGVDLLQERESVVVPQRGATAHLGLEPIDRLKDLDVVPMRRHGLIPESFVVTERRR